MEILIPDEEMVNINFLFNNNYISNRGQFYVGIVKKNF